MDKHMVKQQNLRPLLRKKDVYVLLAILAIYALASLLILPYAQQTANSHMNSGPVFGTAFYVFSAVTLLFGMRALVKSKDIRLFVLLLVLVLSFIYWGFSFHSLYCLRCASGG